MAADKPKLVFLNKYASGARPDTIDFRDITYVPTLIKVPPSTSLDEYRKIGVPISDQGQEGACTGFALATVANYLLRTLRQRSKGEKPPDKVSPAMLYAMAKRYDEWPGDEYEGSSARGAIKGWHKHGVCSDTNWPYAPGPAEGDAGSSILTNERAEDAASRPLGAYFRVNHKDIVAMHSAITEVGILFATARAHRGWEVPGKDGMIQQSTEVLGAHAFAIVAYDQNGFWIQNSWDTKWGLGGFGQVSYDDWLDNGLDVWVGRLGVPVRLKTAEGSATARSAAAGSRESFAFQDLRPHIISIGNQGHLKTFGTYGTNEAAVANIFKNDFPRITKDWEKKRLLLYAHGGLVGESSAIQHLADYRTPLLEAQVYPISFIWNTDFWSTVTDLLENAVNLRKPEAGAAADLAGGALDFMLDRVDDGLEPLACSLGGRNLWDEMKTNALLASRGDQGGARISLGYLVDLLKADPGIELHLVGHSAGAVFHAPIVQLLTTTGPISSGPMAGAQGYGLKVASCTLWAPACTVDLFKATYLPAIKNGGIEHFTLFTLTDSSEQSDNCADVYHKSLLYLVSDAFEEISRIPLIRDDGEPLLGMEKFVNKDNELKTLFKTGPATGGTRSNGQGQNGVGKADWVRAPNTIAEGSPWASTAQQHGAFDDDKPTMRATLARILGEPWKLPDIQFNHSASALRDMRLQVTSKIVAAK